MKELPYLKFNASEWITGKITLEDFYTQGVFINICALYWFRSGQLETTEIKRRLKCKQATIDLLFANGHIKASYEFIRISFLDEQLEERGHISKINSKNGSKGGAPKGNLNAKNEEINKRPLSEIQPETSNIEKRREEEEREEEKKKEEKITPLRALPFESLEFTKAWIEWEQYRKEKKQKLTESTAAKQIQFLGARPEKIAVLIINQSITQGWTGLFELKSQQNGNGKQKGFDPQAAVRNIYDQG